MKIFNVIHSKVACLLILHSLQCTSSMQFGYGNNEGNVNHLRCSYLFSSLSHMQYTRHELVTRIDRKNMSDMSSVFNHFFYAIVKQINSLHNFDVTTPVGVLWVVNFYLTIIDWYYIKQKPDVYAEKWENASDILKTHEFIMNSLEIEISTEQCPQNNEFYTSKEKLEEYTALGEEERSSVRKQNADDALNLANRNYTGREFYRFTFYSMIIDQIGLETQRFQELMNDYNVQVVWDDVENYICGLRDNIINIEIWSTDNFQSFKLYYRAVFNFLSVIVLRLTWKHFLYIKHQNISNVVKYTKAWLSVIQNFGNLLYIDNVPAIKPIAESIERAVSSFPQETILSKIPFISNIFSYSALGSESALNQLRDSYPDSLIREIRQILTPICEDISCTLVDDFKLDGLESSKSVNMNAQINKPKIHDPASSETIRFHSLANANNFIDQLKKHFSVLDFRAIASFISYINELSK